MLTAVRKTLALLLVWSFLWALVGILSEVIGCSSYPSNPFTPTPMQSAWIDALIQVEYPAGAFLIALIELSRPSRAKFQRAISGRCPPEMRRVFRYLSFDIFSIVPPVRLSLIRPRAAIRVAIPPNGKKES